MTGNLNCGCKASAIENLSIVMHPCVGDPSDEMISAMRPTAFSFCKGTNLELNIALTPSRTLEWSTYPLLKKYPWVGGTLIAWLCNNCHPCLPLPVYFSHWWIGDDRRSKGLDPWLRWVLGLSSKANTAYICVYLSHIEWLWHMARGDTYQARLVGEEPNQDVVE